MNQGQPLVGMKRAGSGRDYDCLVCVSGGLRSARVLAHLVRAGMRPLALHLDTGWNTELAVHNLEVLQDRLGCDLWTHVCEWDEYKDAQLAFLKASVIDLDLMRRHAVFALAHQIAARYKIRHIVTGADASWFSRSTASLEPLPKAGLPVGWRHFTPDATRIQAIQAKHGTRIWQSLPSMSAWQWLKNQIVQRVKTSNGTDFFGGENCVLPDDLQSFIDELGLKAEIYQGDESEFLQFFYAQYLPKKGFNVVEVLKNNLVQADQPQPQPQPQPLQMPAPDFCVKNWHYVLKKLDLSADELAAYLQQAPVSHAAYASGGKSWMLAMKVARKLGVF
jgi:hypothetical protein